MAKQREVKQWITMNGKHVPIFEGESKVDAVKRALGKGGDKKETKDTSASKLKAAEDQKNTDSKEETVEDKKTGQEGKQAYKKLDEPHEVTVERRGEKVSMKSYGEGWEEGYHVEHTDYVGGKFIDKGKVGDYEIGEKVNYLNGSKMEPGTIVMAHKYPNGKVEYTVKDKDGDGHSMSSKSLAKTDTNRFKQNSQISKDFDTKEKQIAQNKADVDRLNSKKESSMSSVSIERKLAEGMKKYNRPNADKEAYNLLQAYKKGQVEPERLTMWGVSKDELRSLSEAARNEAVSDIKAGRTRKTVKDPMGNFRKVDRKTEYEKNFGEDLSHKKIRTTSVADLKKQALAAGYSKEKIQGMTKAQLKKLLG